MSIRTAFTAGPALAALCYAGAAFPEQAPAPAAAGTRAGDRGTQGPHVVS
jgi:hypothetical protein